MKKWHKRLLSYLLIGAVIMGGVIMPRYLGEPVYASERDGYVLEALVKDATGIKQTTGFRFLAKNNQAVTLQGLTDSLVITPQIEVTIKASKGGSWLIQPVKPLAVDKIYQFSYKGVTWVFQTESDFRLNRILPANQATNVPVNTGIELLFSQSGAEVENYFEIRPKVEGRFIEKGSVVVFAPNKALQPETVYTVILRKGLPLADSDKKLKSDRVIQFETVSKEEVSSTQHLYINYQAVLGDIDTDTKPSLNISYWSTGEEKGLPVIKTNVYGYRSAEDYLVALAGNDLRPTWTHHASDWRHMSTKGLSLVQSFNSTLKEVDGLYVQEFPSKLKAGYYLIDSQSGKHHFQQLLQVTDLGIYYQTSWTKNLLWVNNRLTGQPLVGATVGYQQATVLPKALSQATDTAKTEEPIVHFKKVKTMTTNHQGVATWETVKPVDSQPVVEAMIIKQGDKQAVLYQQDNRPKPYFYGQNIIGRVDNQASYWHYFQTERPIYQPTDTVHFYGFLKERHHQPSLASDESLQVEIRDQGFWRYYSEDGQSPAYTKTTVKLRNNSYDGQLKLPALAPGHYRIQVKKDNQVVASSYIEVESYVKPAYKIEVKPEKEAIFIGQKIKATAKLQFFEGTPVAWLPIKASIAGGIDRRVFDGRTDGQGQYLFEHTTQMKEMDDGHHRTYRHYYINANAKLPESAELSARRPVKVFMNTYDLATKTQGDGDRKGTTLTGTLKAIDLSRLNAGKAKTYDDYLGQPITNHLVTAKIYRHQWMKEKVGTYYDPINKVVEPQYNWRVEKSLLQTVKLTTNQQGQFSRHIQLKKEEGVYYTAVLETMDSASHRLVKEVYLSTHHSWRYSPEKSRPKLVLNQEKYQLTDSVVATVKQGQADYQKGPVLFLISQEGLRDWQVSKKAVYKRSFTETDIPNLAIRAVAFDGKRYVRLGSQRALFDFSKRQLDLTAEFDKDGYRPGDRAVLNVRVEEKTGQTKQPVKNARVMVALVDEALFALRQREEQNVLEELYRQVDDGLLWEYQSHSGQFYYSFGSRNKMKESGDSVEAVAPEGSDMAENVAGGSIRQEFKDTAAFQVIELDDQGRASIPIDLPDNLTAWRVSLSAISPTLRAGSNEVNLNVRLPFFVNLNMNDRYLAGDQVKVGAVAYGSDLKPTDKVDYTLLVDGKKVDQTTQVKAFERVSLDMGKLTKSGLHQVIVKATSRGKTDAVRKTLYVDESYHQQVVTKQWTAKAGLNLTTNQQGMTQLTFANQGYGHYLPVLYQLTSSYGQRVDQRYLREQAKALLAKDGLNDRHIFLKDDDSIQLNDYLKDDGGISLLPYAESDVDTTIRMLPLLLAEYNPVLTENLINPVGLVAYLQEEWQNGKEKAKALYGLALLKQPVLEQLSDYAKLESLTDEEYLYMALAYAAIGDTYQAKQIYEQQLSGKMTQYNQLAYYKTDKTSKDQDYRLSGRLMVLLQAIDQPLAEKVYRYVSTTNSLEYLNQAELLTYIQQRFRQLPRSEASLTYTYQGKQKKLELTTWAERVTVPSVTLDQFKIDQVSGDVMIVAAYTDRLIATDNDPNLQLERIYYDYNSKKQQKVFKQGDIVKVELKYRVDPKAGDHYYQLVDYAPSGLKPIGHIADYSINQSKDDYYCYRDIDGQKVSFYIGRYAKKQKPLVYYARVVTPGVYRAEGTLIQGVDIKDSRFIGRDDQVTIK